MQQTLSDSRSSGESPAEELSRGLTALRYREWKHVDNAFHVPVLSRRACQPALNPCCEEQRASDESQTTSLIPLKHDVSQCPAWGTDTHTLVRFTSAISIQPMVELDRGEECVHPIDTMVSQERPLTHRSGGVGCGGEHRAIR